MTLTDLELLSRYHLEGDASAFRDLVQAHAGMVFATARRITRDEAMAEDVAQETFFQLARQSRHVTQSVAPWLHRVAWRRACNAVRDDATRRRIEEKAAASEAAVREPSQREATWAEVETVLDAAIDELPDDLRAPLVMHFLQGRSQRDIAAQMGVSQSTVSRTVEDGLTTLRGRLKTRGLLCGAGLAALLAANSATAAPAAVLASAAKLSMSGIGAATVTTPVPAGISTGALLKAGIAALLAAGGVWLVTKPTTQQTERVPANATSSETAKARPLPAEKMPAQGPAAPVVPVPKMQAMAQTNPAATSVPSPTPMPTHELVHSFPKPPMRPSGHLVQDAAGWLWGTIGSGGEYGVGAIFKMRADGTEWEQVIAFNGIRGVPAGSYPRGGVTIAADGTFWGVTEHGGEFDGGTLYHFDPRTSSLTTAVQFDRVGTPWSRPWIAPDGQLWGTTWNTIYRYDPKTRELTTIRRFATKTGRLRGARTQAGLTADGRGFLWGATGEGGASGNGTIFKVDLATGEATTVFDFSGKTGAFVGKQPLAELTLDATGNLWGTTRNGGADDIGTVFKIAPVTGSFTHVAAFERRKRVGEAPETQLMEDGTGQFWGTTSYGGINGHGSIFKLNATTGELSSVVALTGMEGKAMGGPARGDLLPDGTGGFFGVCDFGGRSWAGVVYHLDTKTGGYTVLKDIADTAANIEGSDPRGRFVSDSDGWLWGGTHDGGTHQAGTLYKFDPVANALVTVASFTGSVSTEGPFRGRFSGLPLLSDGKGGLWGSTYIGQSLSEGTIFRIDERTSEFTEVIEISRAKTPKVPAPTAGMMFDKNGFLWASSSSSIVKIDPAARTAKTVGSIGGGGWLRGNLTLDGEGMLWGCSQALRDKPKASIFKIDTATDKMTVVQTFTNADAGWNGWNPDTDMWWDGKGSMWFSAVFDVSTGTRQCTLYELDTRSGELVGSHRSRDFRMINSPVMDERGLFWGTGSQFGFGSPGYIYTFDTSARKFTKLFTFTGTGSQALTGAQLDVARLYRHTDGNYYGMTRMGGPGNGGTIFRLRFGPTPMTQEAVILGDGSVELHGTLRTNGRDTAAAFEWGTDPLLKDARVADAGTVRAGETVKSVQAVLAGLPRGTMHYFRLRGINADNAVPQHGAILPFIIPPEEPESKTDTKLASNSAAQDASATQANTQGQAGTQAPSIKYPLKIIKVPGAGAGLVRG